MAATRVLVIDDDQIILDMLQLALRGGEFEVVLAGSGEEGLSLFHNKKPDLVIADIRMPGMDGYQVIEEIRGGETGGEHTPIIVLTAHEQGVMRAYAQELGVDLYLTKPVAPQKLVGHIRTLISQLKSDRDAPEEAES